MILSPFRFFSFLIFFLCCFVSVKSEEELIKQQQQSPFIVITIPKSGTHLLDQLIYQLTKKTFTITYPPNRHTPWKECWELPLSKFEKLTNDLNDIYLLTHLMYQEEYASLLEKKLPGPLFVSRSSRSNHFRLLLLKRASQMASPLF